MLYQYTLLSLFALSSALPLNINLGAYSPALVVGDGEISFGGKESVTNLMNALEGAAVNSAAANGAAAPGVEAKAPTITLEANAAAAPVAPATSTSTAASTPTPVVVGQGLGSAIEPRPRSIEARSPEAVDTVSLKQVRDLIARDLAGFDRALNFAATALKTGPAIDLGTGEGGSGVGIKVGAGIDNGGGKAKRTTVFVGEGLPEKRSPALEARDILTATTEKNPVEAVTLNVGDTKGLTLTFVETE